MDTNRTDRAGHNNRADPGLWRESEARHSDRDRERKVDRLPQPGFPISKDQELIGRHSAVGHRRVKRSFGSADKLASYFGIVPRVSNSNETVNHGRITRKHGKQDGADNIGPMLSCRDQEKRLSQTVLRTDKDETRPRKSQNRIGPKVFENNLQHTHQQLGVCGL
ncbi:MAG: transposase [Acidobacteria bacterium]|nr:transposase [Acidobacteriota bacterium]